MKTVLLYDPVGKIVANLSLSRIPTIVVHDGKAYLQLGESNCFDQKDCIFLDEHEQEIPQ